MSGALLLVGILLTYAGAEAIGSPWVVDRVLGFVALAAGVAALVTASLA